MFAAMFIGIIAITTQITIKQAKNSIDQPISTPVAQSNQVGDLKIGNKYYGSFIIDLMNDYTIQLDGVVINNTPLKIDASKQYEFVKYSTISGGTTYKLEFKSV